LFEEKTWRPVYMSERSTSKGHKNELRTHRALYVGDFPGADGNGKAYEIRKLKTASILGVLGGQMRSFTDAEEWVGSKAADREPVYLGVTDWTDERLNLEGWSPTQLRSHLYYSLTIFR